MISKIKILILMIIKKLFLFDDILDDIYEPKIINKIIIELDVVKVFSEKKIVN